jgi:hypothetical protein
MKVQVVRILTPSRLVVTEVFKDLTAIVFYSSGVRIVAA